MEKDDLLQGLYAITDPHLIPVEQLLSRAAQALRGGARLIQYRDKQATPVQQRQRAQRLQALCEQHHAALIINDDVALCLEVGAAGVHLGRSDGDIRHAREALGTARILGVTCHDDLHYAQQAADWGADYCAFGRLFPSHTKPSAPPCPLSRLGEARSAGLRVVAIGGLTLSNATDAIAAGAHMVAVIHDLFSHTDVAARARQYTALFN